MSGSLKNQVLRLSPETLDLFLDAVNERIAAGKISPNLAKKIRSDLDFLPKNMRNEKYASTVKDLQSLEDRVWDFAIMDGQGKEYARAYLDANQATTHTVNQLEKALLKQYSKSPDIKAKPISIKFNPDSPIIRALPTREPYRGL